MHFRVRNLPAAGIGVSCLGILISAFAIGWELAGEHRWDFAESAGTWFAGSFTALALIAALLLYQRESDRDRQRDRSERRAQAEKIAAWYGSEIRVVELGVGVRVDGAPDATTTEVWRLWIRNASELPVFDIAPIVRRQLPPGHRRPGAAGTDVPLTIYPSEADRAAGTNEVFEVPVLAPGTTREFVVGGAPQNEPSNTVDLTFRDNARRRWRYERGSLDEINPPADA